MTLKKSETANVAGTCLQGYVYQTYARLVEVFGEPSHDGDGYKTDVEWTLVDKKGNVVTLYNWKNGPNYLREEGTPIEQILEWHIGGKDESVVKLVQAAMPHAKVRKGWY